ncbi:MAG: hypothetical protein Q8O67_09820 [Deltaproteobacteria bacterium]|nr:hypothetical protein [Deltaproteobacteria bacterium]
MIWFVVGGPIALLGLTMMIRGWIYTMRPDGPTAAKRKKRNLQRGFTTDMKVFGRKVRRLGLMLVMLGGFLIGWELSHKADAVDVPLGVPPVTPAVTPS